MSPKARTIMLLLGGIALIFVILSVQLIASPPTEINETVAGASSGASDAQISFSADHKLVIAPSACVTVRWHVEYIEAVYIDGEPTIGDGQQIDCVDETTMPVLRVQFSDNTIVEYRLEIGFLSTQPSTWLLVVAVLLLALTTVFVALARPFAPPTTTTAANARRSWGVTLFAAIGLIVVTILVTGLILELALRFYFGRFGTLDEQIAYVYSRNQINALNQGTLPLPEVDYGLSPNTPDHDALGYRGAEVEIPKPEGTFRIVAMGGSTTYGTSVHTDQSYPAQLQQVLRDQYGYSNVEVVNAGVAGYTTWQTFINLALRVTQLQPDLVIIYHAGNDVLPREVDPDCYAGQNPLRGLDPRGHISVTNANVPLSPSALYRFVAINLGWMPSPADLAALFVDSAIDCGGTQEGSDIEHNVEVNRPIYFERNERNMIAIAREYGFKIMFASWAFRAAAPEALPFWQTAVAEHNAITARVAQDEGALYFDYAAVAPTDPADWADYVHMSAAGNHLRAQAFAQFILDQNVIPKP